MALSITRQDALIGVRTTPGKMDCTTVKPELEMHHQDEKLNITTDKPKVSIDQYPCRATSGLKNMRDLGDEIVGQAKSNAAAYTGKLVDEGNALAAIENGGQPLLDIIVGNQYEEHVFDIATMPSARPVIEVTGSIKIEPEYRTAGIFNGVTYSPKMGKVNVNFSATVVEIYLRQRDSLEIRYHPDKKIDAQV